MSDEVDYFIGNFTFVAAVSCAATFAVAEWGEMWMTLHEASAWIRIGLVVALSIVLITTTSVIRFRLRRGVRAIFRAHSMGAAIWQGRVLGLAAGVLLGEALLLILPE